jgi:hypothetical protein
MLSARKIFLGLTVLIVVGGLYLYRSEERKPSFFYEFGVDVIYKGKERTISRVVECIPPRVNWRTFPARGRSQEAIAEELEDGSGLIVVIPNLCDGDAWPVIPEYVPLILWTENAKNPQLLQAYLSEDLLRSGQDRLTLKRAFARPSSKDKFVGADLDFVQFSYGGSGGNVYKDYHTKGKFYVGLSARVVPREDWMNVAEIAAVLPDVHAAGIVPSSLFGPIDEHFPSKYDWDTLTPYTTNNYPRTTTIRRRALEDSVSLRWVDGAFEIDRTLWGRALVYPVDKIPTIHLVARENGDGVMVITTPAPPAGQPNVYKGSMAISWPLRISETSFEVGRGAIYFEPSSKQIVAIEGVEFFLYESDRPK